MGDLDRVQLVALLVGGAVILVVVVAVLFGKPLGGKRSGEIDSGGGVGGPGIGVD